MSGAWVYLKHQHGAGGLFGDLSEHRFQRVFERIDQMVVPFRPVVDRVTHGVETNKESLLVYKGETFLVAFSVFNIKLCSQF